MSSSISTYRQQRNTPEWRAKRQEVLALAGYKCEICRRSERLQVHHGYYRPGAKVWEYQNSTLWVLCDDCHKAQQSRLVEIFARVGTLHPAEYQNFLALLAREWDELRHRAYEVAVEEQQQWADYQEDRADWWSDYHIYGVSSPDVGAGLDEMFVNWAEQQYPGINVVLESEDSGPGVLISHVDGPNAAECKGVLAAARYASSGSLPPITNTRPPRNA